LRPVRGSIQMKLVEFFGNPIDTKKPSDKKDTGNMSDDLFYYIIDHDKLHKDFFHPTAVSIKKAHQSKKDNKEEQVKSFLPMVNKGCLEYYHKHKMNGRLGKLFPKEMRDEMCERLYDHYREDIVKEKYKLGH